MKVYRLLIIIVPLTAALGLMLALAPSANAQGGGDLIVNGTFDSDLSGWTHSVSPAAWSYSGGKAINGSVTGCIYQDIVITDAIAGVYEWGFWRSDSKTEMSFHDISSGTIQLGKNCSTGSWGGPRFALESGHTYRMQVCAGTSGNEEVDNVSLTWIHDFAPCAADGWCNSDFDDAFHGWEFIDAGWHVNCNASGGSIVLLAGGVSTPVTQTIAVALPTVYEWQFPPGSNYQIKAAVYYSSGQPLISSESAHDDDWIGSLIWPGNYDVALRDGSDYDATRDYFTVSRRATIPQYGSICDIEDNDLSYDDWRWTPVITTSNWYWAQGHKWCQSGGSGGANGCLRQPFTTTITATWHITGYHNGNTQIGIKNDAGSWEYSSSASGVSAGGELGAGRYTVEICDASSSNNCATSVELTSPDHPIDCGQEQYYDDPPGGSWGAGAWIYYPLESYFDMGFYKTYSQTSQYGLPYNFYNVWETTPDAMAYSIAQLEIVDVGTNFLGYYVTARINAWPDVPSTTIKYEGLSSVEVSPGELVGGGCPVGRVSNRWEFGPDTYHLLLGVWFPTYDDDPFNPVPWMTRRPVAGACQVVPPGGGPDPTPGPGGLWEPVCRDCPRPGLADILSIGKWIDWLECAITNLILCWLVRILNTAIAFIQGVWQVAVAFAGWIASQLNGVLDWLGSAWNIMRIGLTNIANSAIRVVMASGIVQSIWGGFQLAAIMFQQGVVLLQVVFSWLLSLVDIFLQLGGLAKAFVEALLDVFDVQAIDMFGFYGFAESGGGAATGLPGGAGGSFSDLLAAAGPNEAKALYILFLGIWWLDYQFGATPLAGNVVLWILYGALAWSAIWWTKNRFEQLAETS